VPRWPHSKKQVRKALDEADEAGFDVQDTSAGHRWGIVRCTKCGQTFSVWSTPRVADNHAKQIRRFIANHSHAEEGE
jgi:predicted Zn finger-like uncharacterized protein